MALVVSAVLVVGVFAGCGGSDDSQTTAEPPTKTEFVAQADSICAKAFKKKVDALNVAIPKLEREKKTDKKTQESLVTDVALPPVSQMAEELNQLGTPTGSKQATEVVKTLERILKEVEAKPALLLANEDPFVPFEEKSAAYGLDSCSEI